MRHPLSLVVEEGQPAWAVGTVIRLGQHFYLRADDGVTDPSDDQAASMVIRLEVAPPYAYVLDVDLGRRVVATGVWTSDRLLVAEPDLLRRQPRLDDEVAVGSDSWSPRPPEGAFAQVRPAVERALMVDGDLLDLWELREPGKVRRYIALAVDVSRVREALLPHYGQEELEVVASRWDSSTLANIEAMLLETDDLLVSIGTEVGEDFQMRVVAVMKHLPRDLALRLEAFPAAAVELRVLVNPVTNPPSAGSDVRVPAHES